MQKYRDEATKALAKEVLDTPENTSKADEIRRKILVELSGIVHNRGGK